MKYKTLFRMLLKVVGVWVVVGAVGDLLQQAGFTIYSLATRNVRGEGWYLFWSVAAQLLQIGIGLYLFFDGRWIADKAIPGNRPYCHECGYDLTNAAGNLCSECGTPFKPAEMSSAP